MNPRLRGHFARWIVLLTFIFVSIGVAALVAGRFYFPVPRAVSDRAESDLKSKLAVSLATTPRLTVWWDFPSDLDSRSGSAERHSNVSPADYVGPLTCKPCHAQNFEKWSQHPHRWMNALATAETVRGDFSQSAAIHYRGGTATFGRTEDTFSMTLERGSTRRVYRVTQTIGSRFYQYYVGRQIEGPEKPDHKLYHEEHVLPFGYWLGDSQWVPVVHIGPELPDNKRPDPFAPSTEGRHYANYSASCNYCHTTFALGDMFGRLPRQIGEHAPTQLHWSIHRYFAATRPDELRNMDPAAQSGAQMNPMVAWEAGQYAVTYGVSCEACHLGNREHVESGGKVRPRFFPASDSLAIDGIPDAGKTVANLNWACGRCHTGSRPSFAAGMSTWNSVEYADAARGSCYSELRCVDCHNPHEALGEKWKRSGDHDDNVCLRCHSQLNVPEARAAHTHHPPGSEGDRCLNCHMPRINEGLQDVVRTHMIFSPTEPHMIEQNQPNACNLCHVDRSIDWTLGFLREWYAKSYDQTKLAASYPHRAEGAAYGWLKSSQESVRLVAADGLARAAGEDAIPSLLQALDDPFMLNRQFAGRSLEKLTGVTLAESGFRFYQTPEERRQPLRRLRTVLMERTEPAATPDGPTGAD